MRFPLQEQLFQHHPKALRYLRAEAWPSDIPAIIAATAGITCGNGWFSLLDQQLDYWERFIDTQASQGAVESTWPFVLSARRDNGELQLTVLIRTPDGIGVMSPC